MTSRSFEDIREPITEITLVTPEERSGRPSMTRHTLPACQGADKDIVFQRAIGAGSWGRILLEKRSLVKNASRGVPVGHLPLDRSFGSPHLHRDRLIGQFHLAHRPLVAPVLNARLRRDEEELRGANVTLQAKIAELERVDAAMIDREERMIELEEEIERLRRGS